MSVAIKIDMISPAEVDRLAELEAVVERGKQTFIEVGAALAEIRDQRLYRAEHTTFEDYCRSRWGFTASRGRQLISGAVKALEIASVTGVTPASEREVRRLTSSCEPPSEIDKISRDNEHLRHDLNRLLPAPEPDLVERIATYGRCLVPIVTFEGLILDGWTRYLASRLGGFIAPVLTIENDLLPDHNRRRREDGHEDVDAETFARLFVYTVNVVRRHLTPEELDALKAADPAEAAIYIVVSYGSTDEVERDA